MPAHLKGLAAISRKICGCPRSTSVKRRPADSRSINEPSRWDTGPRLFECRAGQHLTNARRDPGARIGKQPRSLGALPCLWANLLDSILLVKCF